MRIVVSLPLILCAAGFAAAQQPKVVIQTPKDKAEVAWQDEVSGICAEDGAVAVCFVKGLNGAEWHVQEATKRNKAEFTCNAYFGEEKSTGKFRIVVLAIPKDKAKDYGVGKKVAVLPKEYPASDQITVTR